LQTHHCKSAALALTAAAVAARPVYLHLQLWKLLLLVLLLLFQPCRCFAVQPWLSLHACMQLSALLFLLRVLLLVTVATAARALCISQELLHLNTA
jgi:hypothetical protein